MQFDSKVNYLLNMEELSDWLLHSGIIWFTTIYLHPCLYTTFNKYLKAKLLYK